MASTFHLAPYLADFYRVARAIFGFLEGWQGGGANREVTSPIEGLPDVEESHCISASYVDPEASPHISELLPGISEQPVVVAPEDMDDSSRMKGFGGDAAPWQVVSTGQNGHGTLGFKRILEGNSSGSGVRGHFLPHRIYWRVAD